MMSMIELERFEAESIEMEGFEMGCPKPADFEMDGFGMEWRTMVQGSAKGWKIIGRLVLVWPEPVFVEVWWKLSRRKAGCKQ